jgi:hypothetical protein
LKFFYFYDKITRTHAGVRTRILNKEGIRNFDKICEEGGNTAMADMDFIGFTYNGKHSWRDLGIYRTSDGGARYSGGLTATMTDKTADVPGRDGQYYFGTTFKNKTFTINYAFDELTEEKFQ